MSKNKTNSNESHYIYIYGIAVDIKLFNMGHHGREKKLFSILKKFYNDNDSVWDKLLETLRAYCYFHPILRTFPFSMDEREDIGWECYNKILQKYLVSYRDGFVKMKIRSPNFFKTIIFREAIKYKERKQKISVPFLGEIHYDQYLEGLNEIIERKDFIASVLSRLSSISRTVIELRFFKKYKLKKIKKILNYSEGYLSKIESKDIEKMKRFSENLF